MNRKYILTILFLISTAVILLGCASQDTATEEVPTIPPVIETSRVVSAEAFVVPIQHADIAFESGGRVVEIMVQEGDQVTAGQVLLRLDDAEALAALAEAEAALAKAKANLAEIEAGPTLEQIAKAEAAVTQAQASLNEVKTGATAEEIAIAETAVARAEASLAQVVSGATPEEIAVAQAKVNTLQAQLINVLAGTRTENLEASAASLKQAEADLALAQADYDRIAYAADSEIAQPIAIALQKATLTYEAAQAKHQALLNGATPQEVAVMRAQLGEGQAALEKVKAGATPEQIALAQIGVMEAEANLAQVKAGATPEQIAIAEAKLTEAEAALDEVKAGATPEQITVAEAGVQQAEASADQARVALDRLQLKAPFGGTVADLTVEVGEIVSSGTPVVALADVSTWQIETDDLTEIDVVRVAENQPVEIRIDALEDEVFEGVVSRIQPRSETKAGDVTYTVVIDLVDSSDPRLRWGMTTFVEIQVE
jgi:HlyD family secretion protein